MKRTVYLALIGCMLFGCSKPDEKMESAKTPVIYTVNYPLAYFSERIVGDKVKVVFPEMEGDPAFWQPTPEQIVEFQRVDLILLNGASYAKWVPKVSLSQAKLVNTSAAFSEQFIALDGSITHAHGPGGAHAHGDIAFTTWLDLKLAVQQAAAIRDACSRQWNSDAATFSNGFQELEQDLMKLEAELDAAFTKLGDQPLLGSHPVYQYLIRRYDLDMKSVHWEPDQVPDERMWRELDDILEAHPAKIMLWEGEPLPAVKAALAEKGIDSVVFNPCSNRPDEGDFLDVMRQNAESIRRLHAE
jgi:zinc transport system substrate-binding protein